MFTGNDCLNFHTPQGFTILHTKPFRNHCTLRGPAPNISSLNAIHFNLERKGILIRNVTLSSVYPKEIAAKIVEI